MLSQAPAHKFLTSLFIVILAFLLQVKLGVLLDLQPSLVLASLITISFFVGFLELAFLVLLSILILNWQPAISLEISIYLILPLALFFFRKVIFPLESWVSNFLYILVGLLIFYLASNFSLIIEDFRLLFGDFVILKDLIVSMLFGFFIFQLFNYIYRTT